MTLRLLLQKNGQFFIIIKWPGSEINPRYIISKINVDVILDPIATMFLVGIPI